MWDAHLNMWTDEAINGPAGDQRRAITSFADLFDLIDRGLVTNFSGNAGIENSFINGLRASNAVINCPVICHPFQGENINDGTVVGTALNAGDVFTQSGATSINVCSGDNVSNIVQLANNASNAEGVEYTYVLVYDDNRIGGVIPIGKIELEGSPTLNASIYGLAYTGNLTVNPWADISTAVLSDGEFALSANAVSLTVQNGGCTSAIDRGFDSLRAQSRSTDSEDLVYLTAEGIVSTRPSTLMRSELRVLPNPFNAQLTVAYTATTENAHLIIYHVSGKQVFEQTLAKGTPTHRINTGDLGNGLYLLTIEEEGVTLNIQLIKEAAE